MTSHFKLGMSFLSSLASVVEFLIRWREIIVTKTCRIVETNGNCRNTYFIYATISIPFHPNMNLNLSFSIFAISYIRRWMCLRQCQHSREFTEFINEISAATIFTSFNFHICRFSSFRFSCIGEVNVYRICMCMCFVVSIPCHGIRSSRHQGVSPPTNSPPRNHQATNQLAAK